MTAGAEDFILKPLKMNDVQRLRKCSGATRPKSAVAGDDDRCCNTAKKAAAAAAATPEQQQQQQRSSHLAGLAMVMNASSFEVSHYFQLIFKLILLAYAVLCLSQLLHRWSNGSSLLSLWCA